MYKALLLVLTLVLLDPYIYIRHYYCGNSCTAGSVYIEAIITVVTLLLLDPYI